MIERYVSMLCLLVLLNSSVFGQDKYFEMVKNIEIFTNVYKELNAEFVDEIDPNELMKVGIDAMVSSLDPFTNFFTATQYERSQIERQGKYEGLGILIRFIDEVPTVSEVAEGGPAQQAGVKVGDKILEINSKSILGKTKEEVNQFMRGAPGQNITLTIKRPGDTDKSSLVVSRDEYDVPNVPVYELVDDNIAYVKLTTFTADASSNVKNAIRDLKKKEPELQGIILDLRNNGGGLLREAIALSNLFIDKGKLIVSTRGKLIENDQTYNTRQDAYDMDTPLAILVNDHSASASEIVSGTIQDYDRGVLLGKRTYGKGLVQNFKKLGYRAQMKLTTSKYYIPSGRSIQSVKYENGLPIDIPLDQRTAFKTANGRTVYDGGGVLPDVIIELPEAPGFVEALVEDHIIFNYVTNYMLANPELKDVKTFTFSKYDDFVNFARRSGFEYRTESEALIDSLRSQLKEEELAIATAQQLDAMIDVIKKDKSNNFEEYKEDIVQRIEDDIITRTFFEKGKIRRNLDHDIEVNEAIKILRDQSKYNQLLGKNN